ncbi:MAG: glutathione S-transferase family protein [Myxococcota bacterium]
MGFELYHSPYSTCSQKVRIALAEKGLAWVSREISFARQEQLAPEYLNLNPNGVVPTLVHDGQVVTDSSCIMEYLDEVAPQPPLSPPTALGRARMRAWLRYFEEVPTAAVRVPSFQTTFLPVLRALQSESEFDAAGDRRPIRKGFYRKMNAGRGFSDEEVASSREQLQQTVQRIDAALARGPFILGESYTLAECCVAPLLDRTDDLGMAELWAGRPRFSDWLARVRARPSFREAFTPGSRLSERPEFAGARAARASG